MTEHILYEELLQIIPLCLQKQVSV